ncbi:molybdenum ABC transporter ATP-binding protein [Solirhodobacter olei]|uniref:molybdenum ABC transporter ATP-binding protein n=1 Tax=Solirhodobacter olei TaxID=2493082 RepID=UPI000FD7DD2F|nr:molybdenum ABC transporter ATP-binding protein [Solirhodobacter olei]
MTLSVSLAHAFPGFRLDAAFEAPAGLTVLFGRSGSGKTTVVNAVAGLLRPDRGRVTVAGRALCDSATGLWLPPHRRRIGYVFQEGRLFPHMTVRQNLAYGARFAPRGATGADLGPVVELLGIGHLLTRRPGALSGGEKARVAIGRALLSRPELLLMDEPLAALDQARKEEILPYLERLRDETRVPILYVSHSVAEVARLATTLVLMHEGQVERTGPAAEVLADPASAQAIGLAEAGAVIEARVVGEEADGLSVLQTSAGRLYLPRIDAPPGACLRIRIHASDVILSRGAPQGLSALNILPGRVEAVHLGEGPGAIVRLRSGQDVILARLTRRSVVALGLAPGTECHAIVKTVAVARGDVGTA